MPRSWMLARPELDGLFEVEVAAGTTCGNWLVKASTVASPVFSICFGVTVTIGLSAT